MKKSLILAGIISIFCICGLSAHAVVGSDDYFHYLEECKTPPSRSEALDPAILGVSGDGKWCQVDFVNNILKNKNTGEKVEIGLCEFPLAEIRYIIKKQKEIDAYELKVEEIKTKNGDIAKTYGLASNEYYHIMKRYCKPIPIE